MPLDVLLDPGCVAVVGASDDPDKIGGRPFVHLARSGFAGRLLAVNPSRTQVQGFPSFPDVASLPEVPDVAIVAVAGETAIATVAALAEAGTQVAVVMASGFSEVGDAGRVLETRLLEAARGTSLRIVGPNCMGVCNFTTGAVLTFTTAFLEVPPVLGPVAVVSQSGSMAVEPYMLLAREGIGVRQVHATGNDADVSVFELATMAARDPDVELLLLYFESVKSVGALEELGAVARDRGLPVVALKSGRTPAGRAAARSHTGALATEDRVLDALLDQVGIWRARDLDDLVRTASLHLRGWHPGGNRFAAVSNSGASCVQIADAASGWDLELAALSPDTRAVLENALPSFATTTNPIDVTAAILGNPGVVGEVLTTLAADPGVDALHLALPIAGQGYDVPACAAALAAVATNRPAIVSCAMPDSVTAPFAEAGLPVFRTEPEAVAALGSFLGQRRRLEAAIDHPPSARPVAREGAPHALDEVAGLALLARAGVPVVPHRVCSTPEEAVAAFHDLDATQVVVKGCTSVVAHKSDAGLVRVGLSSAAEVHAAACEVAAALARADPNATALVVAEHVSAQRELLVGAHQDPVFGPVVIVGDGGVHAEVLPDVQVLLPPYDEDDVLAALLRLRAAPVFGGVRGAPPLDLAAVAAATVAVGRLVLDAGVGVLTLDVNPLMVAGDHGGCLAADALVVVARPLDGEVFSS